MVLVELWISGGDEELGQRSSGIPAAAVGVVVA